MTNQTGKKIVSLEQWLVALYDRYKDMKALYKKGPSVSVPKKTEIAEIKLQIADAKLVRSVRSEWKIRSR